MSALWLIYAWTMDSGRWTKAHVLDSTPPIENDIERMLCGVVVSRERLMMADSARLDRVNHLPPGVCGGCRYHALRQLGEQVVVFE